MMNRTAPPPALRARSDSTTRAPAGSAGLSIANGPMTRTPPAESAVAVAAAGVVTAAGATATSGATGAGGVLGVGGATGDGSGTGAASTSGGDADVVGGVGTGVRAAMLAL